MVNKIIWSIIGGTLWGILFCAALAGLFIGINQNLVTIVSALLMGILWSIIISMIWKSLMARQDESSKNYIIAGIIGGCFLGSAIGGLMLAILNRDANFGKVYILGAFLGGSFGFIWSLFKPPMFLGGMRIWGKSGAILGGIWGSFFGTIIGMVATVCLVFWSQANLDISADNLPQLLIAVLIFGSGNGAIGGTISGIIFGGLIMAPPLPLALELIGIRGAIVGAIWGCFLMAIAWGIIGGILSITIGDDLFLNLGISAQVTLLRGVIIGTGIGSIWGIISGAFWGGFGRIEN
ncbi:MAG: hypothetical protein F6K22_05425 [Okeania sp. SIO2F4]|uniref:hypothetical protein n=1 Tax=Okeania sp. SIO2F4 TaxID=2607790 RepID=UPI00142C7AE5|nr:hypothetical protein [Okeania sp. SIO2F4]NES02325.1 hypothetical protein [Okeania sp. SIO2F4]